MRVTNIPAMIPRAWLCALLMTLAGGAVPVGAQAPAQEPVTVKRVAALRDTPSEAGRTLVTLPAQTVLTRLPERQGAWMQVRTAQGETGWVHMFDIGSASSGSTGSSMASGALRTLSNLFNKGGTQAPATQTPTSTLGIRGLGAQDLANAQPNPAAVARAETLRLDAAQAQKFAADAALVPQAVDALPVPPAPRPATAPTPFPSGS